MLDIAVAVQFYVGSLNFFYKFKNTNTILLLTIYSKVSCLYNVHFATKKVVGPWTNLCKKVTGKKVFGIPGN